VTRRLFSAEVARLTPGSRACSATSFRVLVNSDYSPKAPAPREAAQPLTPMCFHSCPAAHPASTRAAAL
jgi:hypothetical protein